MNVCILKVDRVFLLNTKIQRLLWLLFDQQWGQRKYHFAIKMLCTLCWQLFLDLRRVMGAERV